MNLRNAVENKRIELISIARSMLDGKINLIEGVRKICSLRHEVGDPDNEVFLSIRAIDSETDHFPIGQIRERCTREYLERMDKKMQHYVADAKDDIFTACREILKIFS